MGKFGAAGILGPIGWLVAALLGIWLLLVVRSRRTVHGKARQKPPGETERGEDIFAGLGERYARAEVGPDEYTEELLRVPGAMGLYDVFKRENGRAKT